MTLERSEVRDAAQARRQAAQAIEKHVGSNKELYQYNRSLVEALWAETSEFHAAWIARVAAELGLDILLGEVIWYQGRPYVTIKSLTRLLNRHPQFDNFELEPTSTDLRAAMRVAREEEQVWVCRLWRKDRTRPAIGYGRATPEDTSVGYGRIEKEEASKQERPPSAGSGQALSASFQDWLGKLKTARNGRDTIGVLGEFAVAQYSRVPSNPSGRGPPGLQEVCQQVGQILKSTGVEPGHLLELMWRAAAGRQREDYLTYVRGAIRKEEQRGRLRKAGRDTEEADGWAGWTVVGDDEGGEQDL